MRNLLLIINQTLIEFFMFILKTRYNIKVNHTNLNLERNKKYIIVSNHKSKLDPFLITTSTPLRTIHSLIPYRYLTTEDYMEKSYLRYFLIWCGCFSNMKNKRPIDKAQNFLDRKETLFIFPEGKINKKNKFDKSIKLGIGAIYLEKNNPKCYLLPVKISYPQKREIEIRWGKPFRHKKFPDDLQPLIKKTMKNIYELQ